MKPPHLFYPILKVRQIIFHLVIIVLNTCKMFVIKQTDASDSIYSNLLYKLYLEASQVKNSGIAIRDIAYLDSKIEEGKGIVALINGSLAGFCYIESWEHDKYVANSGLIVTEVYRDLGIANKIKHKAFSMSTKMYPNSKIFGLTTSLAVMRINSALGYRPVTYNRLTTDEEFWYGCSSCPNYDILRRTNRETCLCTAMVFDPNDSLFTEKQLSDYKIKNNEE